MNVFEIPRVRTSLRQPEAADQIDLLRRALLEIEWASRRARPTPALRRITVMARTALRDSAGSRAAAR
jgi:hypothetical protein